jgi:RND family efflux transporter MFP subunit
MGHIRAQEEINLAFRIDGKLVERRVNVGDRISSGQLIARLEPQNEQNALRAAEAELAMATAALSQALKMEAREKDLFSRGFRTRVQYGQALQQLQSAESQVDSARARLNAARDRVGYTELRADIPALVIAKGAEPGEVIRAGQMVVLLAADGRKDAVFEVPAKLLLQDGIPNDPIVEVTLADNDSIRAEGRVREVTPQADSSTRTFPIRVSLVNPPQAMYLGATVKGAISLSSERVVEIPSSAIMEDSGKPAVWIADPIKKTVSLRVIGLVRYETQTAIVADGLKDGELVVTSGAQLLRPGQPVTLLQDGR